ncbi:MAG TPA: bifunctional aspartate kinase/homoserine dehydrogenase I [Myxococcota bacterium]
MAGFVVHKFGGTSVADAERYRAVAAIIKSEPARAAVVVSAMAKVTDGLLDACARASSGDSSGASSGESSGAAVLAAIVLRHHGVCDALLDAASAARVKAHIDSDAESLRMLLRAASLLKGRGEAIDEYVAGHGELWSARMLAAHLGCAFLDARTVLVVRPHELGPVVDWDQSKQRALAFMRTAPEGAPVIITGFIASTPEGAATTLQRNGSDFSASIFGALLDASAVTIWTDVDGVLSADPRRVPEAVLLDEMSYLEAMELAYFGAKVVHPRTMQPAVDKKIPIWIKNTFRPQVRGTVIHEVPVERARAGAAVKGFTTIDDVALLNLEGTGMVGVPGIAERLFGALRGVGVSVIVISQASSEHSICFAVKEAQAELARSTVERAFAGERQQGLVSHITVQSGCSVLAAVGDAMAERPGVAARFFQALADVGVSVRAVAQGSSERNITAVIAREHSTRALRAVHARFTLSNTTLSLAVIGTGGIGRALLKQLEAQREELRARHHVDIRVRAVANSTRMVLGEDGVSADALANSQALALDLDALAAHARADHIPHTVIVDCSASEGIADRYADWLARGIHVVTPNKKAASGSLVRWRSIEAAARAQHALYLGEATVGAGLPVVKTLQDLLLTGDRVRSVDGVLSGTLSFIFNSLQPGESFSAAVREARRLGYTEPDPREDLSGLDFARKLVVLARAMGRDVSLEDVVVEDLAPGVPLALPIDELVRALAAADKHIVERQRAAEKTGAVLRYAGAIPEEGAPRIELRAVPRTHPFARLTGTDNIVAFTTQRYDAQPLLVQGPGAGPEVTAGGVFGDLLRLAAHLGATL